jgi:hypothetical protein
MPAVRVLFELLGFLLRELSAFSPEQDRWSFYLSLLSFPTISMLCARSLTGVLFSDYNRLSFHRNHNEERIHATQG